MSETLLQGRHSDQKSTKTIWREEELAGKGMSSYKPIPSFTASQAARFGWVCPACLSAYVDWKKKR